MEENCMCPCSVLIVFCVCRLLFHLFKIQKERKCLLIREKINVAKLTIFLKVNQVIYLGNKIIFRINANLSEAELFVRVN